MKQRLFACLLVASLVLSLGACASEEGGHDADLGPGAIVKMSGVTGTARIENHGPGVIQVSSIRGWDEQESEVVLESVIQPEFDGAFSVHADDTLKIVNIDEGEWASVRLTYDDCED